MNSRRWFWATLGLVAGGALFSASFSYAFDIFGIYRDAHGRSLPVYGLHRSKADDRYAKFLLNQHYVPENFSGLIIGSSGLANWQLPDMGELHYYTEATPASNATEQGIFVRQALKRGHFQGALIELFPAMTGEHRVYEGIETEKSSDAFATINSVGSEIDMLLVKFHLQKNLYFPDGARDLMVSSRVTPDLPIPLAPIDPVALASQRELVKELEADGVRVVYVVTPIYEPVYLKHVGEMQTYLNTVLAALPPAPVLNLNDDQHAAFSSVVDNFDDDLHLSLAGAARIEARLNTELPPLLEQAKLIENPSASRP